LFTGTTATRNINQHLVCFVQNKYSNFATKAFESKIKDIAKMSNQDITYNNTTRNTAMPATTEQEVHSCFNFTHSTNPTKLLMLYCTKYYKEFYAYSYN
jgi:NCAIR mutase (PurE)-related protein